MADLVSAKTFSCWNPITAKHEMTPAQLRAIRMDMGVNMVAMACLLQEHAAGRVSRDRYRSWEKPRTSQDYPFIPKHIAKAAESLYASFNDFVAELVSLYDGESPLVLIHRNDMFKAADLPLPKGIGVDNYNQAVGKAWGRILKQGYIPELVYFSTDPTDSSPPKSRLEVAEVDPVQEESLRYVGEDELLEPLTPRSFVSWGKGVVDPGTE